MPRSSADEPRLGVVNKLDPPLVGSVMVEAGHVATRRHSTSVIDVSSLDSSLQDAVVRLIRLTDSPTDARVLAPLVAREIIYRLLMGEQGGRLQHIAALGGYADGVSQAIERLRNNFDKPMRIEHLAREID